MLSAISPPFVSRLFLMLLFGFIGLKAIWFQPYVEMICVALAKSTYGVLWLFGQNVHLQDNMLAHRGLEVGLVIVPSCSALTYCLFLVSFGVSYSTTIFSRILLVVFGIVVLQIINIGRLISLIYAKAWLSEHDFGIFHERLWPFLFAVISVLLVSYWVKRTATFDDALPESAG